MEQKTGQNSRKSLLGHTQKTVSEERTFFDTVGDELKRARLAKQIDIETASNSLKIKSTYLEALENNDYSAFPAVVYGVAFLRSYARFLGLEVAPLTERFKRETNHLIANDTPMPIPAKHNVMPGKGTLLVCFILLACLWGGWYVITRPQESEVIMTSAEVMTQVPEPVVTAPIESDMILNQSIEEIAGELNTVVPTESLNPQAQSKAIESVASSDTADTAPLVSDEAEKEPNYEGLTGQKFGQEQGAKIVFVATDRVWMDVKDNGAVLFNRILSKGDAYFVPADMDNLIMRTGNARGLNVYVNGELTGVLSQTETVKNNIVLKPETFKKH